MRLRERGCTWRAVADLFHVARRTLARWRRNELVALRSAVPLGRPVRRSPPALRNQVFHLLEEVGPGLGVPSLRDCFPALGRAELDDFVRRYRKVWRHRQRIPWRVLHWTGPGRVWAIDFTGPLPAIEGQYPYVLAVRDLASGCQLLWQPAVHATADVAHDALAALFVRHGPPLVLKSDNGSPFTAGLVADLLVEHDVTALLSPPYWPRYNGAIEAGIGALKGRTESHAARVGHPGYWTWDDLEAARAEANALARPFGPTGPSPDTVWTCRSPIAADERALFRACVRQSRMAPSNPENVCINADVGVSSTREMERNAIRLALEQRGYLHYRRRLIAPPINRPKVAIIT
jgi:transposase InsO family protein